MIAALIALVVFFVAYANGANSNFKGVASLYGSGTCGFKTAVGWAAVATVAGSVASVFLAAGLLQTFSGKGLLPEALITDPVFLLAVAVGAMLTGVMATGLGFPVSTTHGLTGGLLGAGLLADAAQVNIGRLWGAFAVPLILGPLLAIMLGALIYAVLRRVSLAPCHRTGPVDALHFLSAGAVCFARGMNDTPKMTALLGGVGLLGGMESMGLIAVAMTLGGWLSARKVAETLAHKITDLDPGQGFAANLTTAFLVILGSVKGLPLSTTHVTVGALLGIGITTKQAKWRSVIPVLLAWVITVPCAAILAALSLALARHFYSILP